MRRNTPLGRTQQLVLHLLAERSKSVREMAYDWPGTDEGSIRSAVHSLGRRSLVDATGFDQYGRSREFGLTAKGAEAEEALLPDEDWSDA